MVTDGPPGRHRGLGAAADLRPTFRCRWTGVAGRKLLDGRPGAVSGELTRKRLYVAPVDAAVSLGPAVYFHSLTSPSPPRGRPYPAPTPEARLDRRSHGRVDAGVTRNAPVVLLRIPHEGRSLRPLSWNEVRRPTLGRPSLPVDRPVAGCRGEWAPLAPCRG